MTDTTNNGGDAGAAAAAAAAASATWHTGMDSETVGWWQNKGYDLSDPKKFADGITKNYRALEKHMGAPHDQIVIMPKQGAPEADVKAFHQRLGAPADPKDYDFSTIKTSDGKDVPPAFLDSMRGALAASFVPKDKATSIAAAVVKYAESEKAARETANEAALNEQKAELERSWGVNKEFNRLKAMEGARRLGLTDQEAAALAETAAVAGAMRYDRVMDMFRRIGVGTSEDNFVERGTGSNGNPTTREGAVSRLAELKADPAWTKRLLEGDAATKREWHSLEQQITGEAVGF